MCVIRIILAACIMSMLPLKSLAYGELNLIPKLGMEENKFAPGAMLHIVEPISIFDYVGSTGIDSYPSTGNGFQYAISSQHGMVFSLGPVSFGPHYQAMWMVSEGRLRNTMMFQLSYKLWE